jgi:hypothetical protein
MKHPRVRASRTACGPAAVALLIAVSGVAVAQPAANSAPPATVTAPAVTPPHAMPGAVRVSPHARAARERALAKAESAPAGSVRVSPFTSNRKPHKPAAAH